MSVWKGRRKSAPGNHFSVPTDVLKSMLESGAFDNDSEFQPPGEPNWLSPAAALVHLKPGLPMGKPIRGAPLPAESAADPMAPVDFAAPSPAPSPSPAAKPLVPQALPPAPRASQPAPVLPAAVVAAPAAAPAPRPATPAPLKPATKAPISPTHLPTTSASSDGGGAPLLTRRKARPADSDEDELEMTPMIDMTFLLLIFFMVAGTISQHGNIDLPEATTGGAEDPRDRVVLLLDFPNSGGADANDAPGARPILLSEARLRLTGGEEIAASDLEARLREEFADKPAGQLVLQAHRKMPSSVVRQVLKTAQQAGARETLVGVAVSP